MTSPRKVFTLRELLVVAAILAAILFPVLAQAKAAAKKAACLSNLKQLGTATYLFTDDTYPMTWWWDPGWNDPLGFMGFNAPEANPGRAIFPYIKSMDMLSDSTARPITEAPYTVVNNPGAGKSSYVFNGCIRNFSTTAADDIANLISWQESVTVSRSLFVQPAIFGVDSDRAANGFDINWAGVTHGGDGGNYAYADGHAKFAKRNAVKYANFGVSGTVHLHQPGDQDVPNTTAMTKYPLGSLDSYWWTWGVCDPANTGKALN